MASKCESQGFVVRSEQMGKLKDQDIIFVSVTDNLTSCAKIDTRTINEGENNANIENLTSPVYNAANVPDDEFGCSKNKCYNTGTFQGSVAAAATDVVIGNFKKTMDGNLYLGGIVSGYVMLPDGDHQVSLQIADYTEADWTNSNIITTTVHATQGGTASAMYPVKFDLGDLSQTQGTGWTKGSVGVKIRFTIAGANLAAGDRVGVSSIAFYEGIEDFQINQVVGFTCVDTAGDNQSLDVIEGSCSQSEYNSNSGTMTFSMTVNKWTKNFEYLNPTWHTSDESEFGIPHIVTRKVTAGTGELADYGIIQLSDMIEGDCGYVLIQTPGCANNSSQLTRVSSPVPIPFSDADSDKFIVLGRSYNGDESLGMILVGKQWVGQELNVVYRQKKEAEVSIINNEFREFNCTIMCPFRRKDGTTEWHYYENAFLTTDANNISRTDETTKELQFSIAADENGIRKKIVRPRE